MTMLIHWRLFAKRCELGLEAHLTKNVSYGYLGALVELTVENWIASEWLPAELRRKKPKSYVIHNFDGYNAARVITGILSHLHLNRHKVLRHRTLLHAHCLVRIFMLL